jgi:hypothetical protein
LRSEDFMAVFATTAKTHRATESEEKEAFEGPLDDGLINTSSF